MEITVNLNHKQQQQSVDSIATYILKENPFQMADYIPIQTEESFRGFDPSIKKIGSKSMYHNNHKSSSIGHKNLGNYGNRYD